MIPVGGDHFNRAVAAALKIGVEDAKVLRIKLAHAQPCCRQRRAATRPRRHGRARPSAPAAPRRRRTTEQLVRAARRRPERRGEATREATPAAPRSRRSRPRTRRAPATLAAAQPRSRDRRGRVEQACREPLAKLVEELVLCRRYHESWFPSKPVDRLVFVGGEARQRWLCQGIAREMMLARRSATRWCGWPGRPTSASRAASTAASPSPPGRSRSA